MSRSQTRRSVSVKGATYTRIKTYVAEHGGSISGFLEDLLLDKLGPPDDEDHRKFGEAQEKRQKESEARKAEATSDDDFDEKYIPPLQFF